MTEFAKHTHTRPLLLSAAFSPSTLELPYPLQGEVWGAVHRIILVLVTGGRDYYGLHN